MDPNEIIENEETFTAVLNAAKEKGYNIRTADEETTYKERLAKQIEDEKISPRLKQVASDIERDVFESTGIEKNPNEKYYEYLKRAGKTLKEQFETVKAGQKDPAEFEAKFKELENNYRKSLQEKEAAYQELSGKVTMAEKSSLINGVYGEMKANFDKSVSGTGIFKKYEADTLNEIAKNSAIVEDGGKKVLVATDSDGNPLKDGNLNYIPVDKVLKERFKEAMPEGKTQTGAGTGKSGETVKGKESGIVRPANVDTKMKAAVYLRENYPDLKMGTKEHSTAWRELTEGLPAQ